MRNHTVSGIIAPMKTRRKQREKRAHAGLWTILVTFACIGAVLFGGYTGAMALVDTWCKDLPSVEDAGAFDVPQKSRIYANDGKTLLAELYVEDREPVTIDEVSPWVLKGTVATEDERFYQHHGADLQGILRAVVVNLTGGREGASTITQQFIRNTMLADEMTEISIKRKVREIELATQLEKVYSKDEILMMYLNTINYGDGKYGIEAASQHYYSKPASELNIPEAATLIGIPNSPSYYNPTANPESSLERRNVVLARMLSNEVITQEEYDEAINTELNLNVAPEDRTDGILKFPWFTSYVREQLMENYSSDQIFKGGLTVITSIDPKIQNMAEQAVRDEYESGTVDDDQEIALTCIDPHTGFIKAMIGGRNYNEDQFNIATSKQGRSAGSSFKTFTLTAAIEQGISPETKIDCSGPFEYNGWEPKNYGNEDLGIMSIRNMTAISSNIGYARLVTAEDGVSPESIVEMAHRMGITSGKEQELDAYPAVTLGTARVNTLQMASAYGTLAAEGVHHDPIAIIKITDAQGNVLEDRTEGSKGEQVISKEVAYAVTDVLKGVVYSSYGTAPEAALPSGQEIAGKTGTSENWRDLWFCGYTPQLSTSVWIGAREEREQHTHPWCANVFRNFMDSALSGSDIVPFEVQEAPLYNNSFKDKSAAEEEKKKEEEEKKKKEEAKKQDAEQHKPESPDTKDPVPAPKPEPKPEPSPEPQVPDEASLFGILPNELSDD